MVIVRWFISCIRGAMLKDKRNGGEDPWWYERSYINGHYGDRFVEEGHSRRDLKGFRQWLTDNFGPDLH